ncbi:transglycosylase domain-containing protein [Arthrobacter sp. H14-L1]|uniref:transglycosylase domain-containing protein n=1 Tax=Arthrobacter sp. H14-L1 TaxID=2996697 RepID=UPI00226F0A98|nr:transglycosylase domain-containing protein [Arthrobacter sp. H14-L1]MCY0905573.1 transglycosylase domain-containing protein [Arthrobacter sp. H14-L1]
MAALKNPIFDTATTLGKILGFLAVSGICGVLVAGLMVPAVAVTGTTASNSISFFDNLPGELKIDAPAQSTKVLANDGSVLATFYDQNRQQVGLDAMSPFIKEGIVAIEDSRFYEHGGIDSTGILRALVATAQGGRQGASTLTQQYVNNVIIQAQEAKGNTAAIKFGDQKTVGDKVREMKLAIALEKKYSKDEILRGYLNIVYFANGAYGIEAAANLYFGVSAKDLTLPQAALLAGVVNWPEHYDPIHDPANALGRRNMVLDKLLQSGKITKADHDAAVATPVTLNVQPSKQGCTSAASAPYFCAYVRQVILNSNAYGSTPEDRQKFLDRGGLTIKTTLDPRLQTAAQNQVNDTQPADDPSQKGTSLVTVEPGTGKILAMAQNTVYSNVDALGNTNLNFNVDQGDGGGAGFQPGSTMKVVTFTEWLNEGHSMNEVVDASKRLYPGNFPWKATCMPDKHYFGAYDPAEPGSFLLPNDEPGDYQQMTVLKGITRSINTATFASAAKLDLCGLNNVGQTMGLHDATDGTPLDWTSQISSLIGGGKNVSPLTMANGFATFASGGIFCNPTGIVSITDYQNKTYPVPGSDCKQTIKPEVAAGVNYALQNVVKEGSGYGLGIPGTPVGAKTGTTDGSEQTWFIGYTPKLATASWWGYWKEGATRYALDYTYKGKFYPQVDGAYIAGPQWQKYMKQAVTFYPGGSFTAPPPSMLGAPTAPRQQTPAPSSPATNPAAPASAPAPSAPAPPAPAASPASAPPAPPASAPATAAATP